MILIKKDPLGSNFSHQLFYSETKKTSLKMTTMKKKRSKKITSIDEKAFESLR
jgi:hypothetical protein